MAEHLSCSRGGMRWLPAVFIGAILAGACGNDDRSYVANVGDGESSPTMSTFEVETFISDSGYTRYHISTPIWKMYEEAAEPFWRFPVGLNLQQYDLSMKPDATMDCDSAIYYSRKRLWQLDGHVMMVNTLRDTFLSQQLFWDQAKRLVYTDSFIHIVRSDRIIEGYGFESNENMTAYTINRPTAILPVQRRGVATSAEGDFASADSVAMPAQRRGAARQISSPRQSETLSSDEVIRPRPASSGSDQKVKLQTNKNIK